MNTDNFMIESSDIDLAQSICKMITDAKTKNRAVANAIAGSIASKFFDREVYDVDSESGLHNIGLVLERIDVSDIYINNAYIDARVFFSEEEICVPVSHFENSLLPVAYMFIKITPDLSGASVVGFITPENISRENPIDGYYPISDANLQSFYDIESLITTGNYVEEVSDKDIFSYIDNTLENPQDFYSIMLQSRESRVKLAKAVKAQLVFKFVSVNVSDGEFAVNHDEYDITAGSNEDDNALSYDYPEENTFDLQDSSGDYELVSDDDSLLSGIEESVVKPLVDYGSEESADEVLLDNSQISEELDIESDEIIETNEQSSVQVETLPETEVPVPEKAEVEEKETKLKFTTVASPASNSESILDELSRESEANQPQSESNSENQNIETLFTTTNTETDNNAQDIKIGQKDGNSILKPLIIIALLAVAGVSGYYFYNGSKLPANDVLKSETNSNAEKSNIAAPVSEEVAMPVETIEAKAPQSNNNEGVSDTIPAIEQNLDASILVSNLKVEWEIPAGYASNVSAKRYLIKLGKIIQLNLKTELLLLNKPPITNKIAVELKYNSSSKKFETAGVTISSGEKSVDTLILETVNKALAMNLSVNTDSFSKLQENPILIIHL